MTTVDSVLVSPTSPSAQPSVESQDDGGVTSGVPDLYHGSSLDAPVCLCLPSCRSPPYHRNPFHVDPRVSDRGVLSLRCLLGWTEIGPGVFPGGDTFPT